MTEKEKILNSDYTDRIHRVFEHIADNLDSDLSLNTLSQIAHFSPFHFHRIFKFVTTETLNQYITRQKVERSASDLIHGNLSISEIARKNGFVDHSTFTRTFKKFYDESPSAFRTQNPNKFSKIRQLHSKNGQEYPGHDEYLCIIDNLKEWINMNASIEVKEVEKMNLAYISCVGLHQIESTYQKIMKWAIPRGLLNDQTKMITIYHDSFKVTDADKVRMDASILLTRPVELDEEIGGKSIDAGKCIVGRFTLDQNEFEKSWTGLFLWMNENGYKKADRNGYAIYHNNYNEHPERKSIVDLCIPIM